MNPVVEAQVLDRLEHNHPGFYQAFASDIGSGEHVTVRDALTEASDYLLEAVTQVTGESGRSASPNSSLFVVLVAVMGVVAVAWLAAGVSVLATGMVAFWDGATGARSIPKDEVVNTIVQRLRPVPAGA